MKLAVISPWPNEKTGIADGCFAYVEAFTKFTDMQVFVYTTSPEPVPLSGVEIRKIDDFLADVPGEAFDVTLMHLGNNDFHIGYREILQQHECVVHLHDNALHHLWARETIGNHNEAAYFDEFATWYGKEAAEINKIIFDKGVGIWDTTVVTGCPMFEPYLKYAKACIVTSDYSRERIVSRFPKTPVHKVNMISQSDTTIRALRESCVPLSESDGKLHVGCFGIINPSKLIDIVLKVVAKVRDENDTDIVLHVVGGITEPCKGLEDLAKKLKVDALFYGYTEQEEYLTLMSRMDFTIALRYPSMGETSGVVNDSMQLGVPVIVSDVAWYAELPGFVPKVDVGNTEEGLYEVFTDGFVDLDNLAKNKQRFQEFADLMQNELFAKQYYKALYSEISI